MNQVRITFYFLYLSLQLIVLLILFNTRNNITDSINHSFPYFYFILDVLSIYFFIICGFQTGQHYPNPQLLGGITSNLSQPSENIPTKNPLNQEEISSLSSLITLYIESDNGSLSDRDSDDNYPEYHFCNTCMNIQPYRTKHCYDCKKCVPKYDHHCVWIGGCVGELNHRLYWAFLFCQSIINFRTFYIFYQAFPTYSSIDQYTGKDIFEIQFYFLLFTSFVLLLFSAFTSALLILHTLLIATGQTTWEVKRRQDITYLKIYQNYFNPFNKGVIQNIKLAFFHKGKLQEWKPVSKKEAMKIENKQFNLLCNQYYSC